MEDRLGPATRRPPGWDASPSGPGTRSGEEFGVDTAQFSSRVSHTLVRARAHRTHTRTHNTYTHASTHTRAHPLHAGARSAAGSKLCALVRSYPSPLGSSRGNRGTRGGTVRCLGPARLGRTPPSVPGRSWPGPAAPGSRRSELNKAG